MMMGYRAQVVIVAVIAELLHTHTHILCGPRRQTSTLNSAGDDPGLSRVLPGM